MSNQLVGSPNISSAPKTHHKVSGRRVWDGISSFMFTIPFLICFSLFLVAPLVFGIVISLRAWNPLIGGGPFVGLKNYMQLFSFTTLTGHDFWLGFANTAIFTCISVPLLMAIPLAIAYLIYRSPLKSLFRPIFFFPTVLSATAITTVWDFLLQTQNGPVNSLIHAHIPWLVRQPWAWISIDIATIWWSMGFNMVIIYAALTQIPDTTIEAAKIDGASSIRTFWSIAVPQVRNVLSFVIVVSTIASFNLFAQPMLMTGGGPNDSTMSLSFFIYQHGFNDFQMGPATAMAFLMGIILAVVSLIQYRLARKED